MDTACHGSPDSGHLVIGQNDPTTCDRPHGCKSELITLSQNNGATEDQSVLEVEHQSIP